MASPQAAIVTGGLKGHVLLVQVEGGGQGALGLVCAHRAAAQQRIGALSSASGALRRFWPRIGQVEGRQWRLRRCVAGGA